MEVFIFSFASRSLLALVLFIYAPVLNGQSPANSPARNSFTAFGTVTFANSDFYAQAFDRHLSLFGIRYSRVLAGNHALVFSYTPEIIPAALLTEPVFRSFTLRRSVPPFTGTQLTYGAGANPLGLEFLLLPQRRIQPFVSSSIGFLYFSRNVPSIFAAQFNFAVDARAGVRIPLRGHKAISVAYVFHHFSNGFQALDNPGVDSQMIYLGYTFSFHHRKQ